MLKVYYLKVSDYEAVSEVILKGKVSEDSQKTAASFRNEKMRRLKWLGEGMVRSLMKSEFHLQEENYLISRAEHGKPYIQGAVQPVFYNLSHSGDYIVCGLSDREIGIDIQQTGSYRPEIVRRFFHPNEILRLEKCKPAECKDLFFSYWAAKESFLKYTGTGLSASLSGFEVSFEGKQTLILKADFQKQIYMKECRIDDSYKCFVCSEYSDLPEISPFVFAGL